MPRLEDLKLVPDAVGADISYDQIPDQFSQHRAAAPPDPGIYRFQLPTDMSEIWDTFDAQNGQRLSAIFDDAHPLLIIQAPDGKLNGHPFTTRINNAERARGKEKIDVSDMDYLLRALGVKTKPSTNAAYANALQQYQGKTFQADVEWNWNCQPNRPIYIDNGQGGSVEHPEKQPGCGARYYQGGAKGVQKGPDGKYPLRITCATEGCHGIIRAFANLTAFKP